MKMQVASGTLDADWSALWRRPMVWFGWAPVVKRPDAAVQFSLKQGVFRRVDTAEYSRIQCVQGMVWITKTGCGDDVTLKAGESVHLENHGQVLIEALSSAQLLLNR